MSGSEYASKRVVVTGCASGIGRAAATALVAAGAEVVGLDKSAAPSGLAASVQVDLSDPESVEAAAGAVDGRVDALFNCAGAPPTIPSVEILKVNFLGTRLLTELLVERMPVGSAIVNTSSDGGAGWRKKLPLLTDFLALATFDEGVAWFEENEAAAGHAYSFSKEALNLWTLQQSAVLIQRGIRINTSSPGAVQTPMLEVIEATFPPELIAATEHPIGRRSTPEEQVGALLFLGSDAASYVNGADLAVDGGYSASMSVTGALWS